MKAIILAAGIGSRLRPITNSKPKTLVKVNGKPILGYILEALEENGIKDIVICVGFMPDLIINYCESIFPNMNFNFVENKEFDATNNMYSLYLARRYFNEDILIINGDVIFDPRIIKSLVSQKNTSIAVDKGTYLGESMKITVNKNNSISGISKEIPKNLAYGSSIDIYKIQKGDLKILKDEMNRIINRENKSNQWTEVMLNNLFSNRKLKAVPYDIGCYRWCEIDNLEDLADAEIRFNKLLPNLKDKKIFFIDRDGTLTLDNYKIDGADEFIQILKNKKKKFYVITNNSSKTPQEHLEILNRAGFNFSIENILVSTRSAIEYLKKNKIKRLFYIANANVSNYLKKSGFVFDAKKPQALLLTYDNEITYSKLVDFCKLVNKGVPYYASHIDVLYPSKEGLIPDIGSFIEIIKITTGKTPNLAFGKPNKSFIEHILKKEKLSYKDGVVIGDRLYTDIKLAKNSTMTSVLVLTGEVTRQVYENSNINADIICKSILEIVSFV